MGAMRVLGIWMLACVLALAGCGGGGGGGGNADPSVSTTPTIGSAGGQVALDDGARVVVPAGAFTQAVTLRIAKDSTGAPALPPSLKAAGSIYAITPHGGSFAQPVEVRLPLPATPLRDNEAWAIAKADPGGAWVVQGDSEVRDGMLVTRVQSFSFFMPVVVTYATSLSIAPPWTATIEVLCDGLPCAGTALPTRLDFVITTNQGQLPAACTQGATIRGYTSSLPGFGSRQVPVAGSEAVIRLSFEVLPVEPTLQTWATLVCDSDNNVNVYFKYLRGPAVPFDAASVFAKPRALSVVQMPAAVEAAPGVGVDIRAVLAGGASQITNVQLFGEPAIVSPPTARDQAITTWFVSRDQGASWTALAESFQVDADPTPFAALAGSFVEPLLSRWLYWSHTLRFGPAFSADDGALVRVRSCYTASDAAEPACVTGPSTRIVVLQNATAPSFSQQPRSIIVQPGQTASLSAVAGGAPAPTLQWQTRAAGASTWTDIAAGQGAAYTTPALALSDDGVQYRVVATNAAGSTASDVVTVFVRGDLVAPSIGTQPQPVSVAAGSEAVFAVNATGTEALSYQWFKGGTAITGANAPQLKLAAVTPADAGAYTVRVSNAGGSVTSNAATLTVGGGATAPVIVTQPAAVNVTAGSTATFAVGVTGSAPMSFQWRKDGIEIAGATAAAYTLPAAATGDEGDYTVRVSNSAGSTLSQVATLTVAAAGGPPVPPSFTTQPSGVVVAPGMSFTLAATVGGTGPFVYEWVHVPSAVPVGRGPVLRVDNAGAADAGSYQLQVTPAQGGAATIRSDVVQVVLLGAPAVVTAPQATTGFVGATATFSVGATGDALRYLWLRNGLPIGGAEAASYTTPVLGSGDSGALYSVIVYNGAGAVVSPAAVLTVVPSVLPPVMTLQPVDATVTEGGSATFDIAFSGTPPFNVARWKRVGGISTGYPDTSVVTVSGNSFSMTTGPLTAADNGAQFWFEVWNGAGRVATLPGTVTVTAAPPPPPLVDVSAWRGKVAAGDRHSCAIAMDNTLACWGYGGNGQIGVTGGSFNTPTLVPLTGPVHAVSAGANSTCAIHDTDRRLSCMGGVVGQSTPQRIALDSIPVTGVAYVSVGAYHACFAIAGGVVACLGDNSTAQLGQGDKASYPTPMRVLTPGGTYLSDVRGLAAGSFHTCAVTAGNQVACWGNVNQEFDPLNVRVLTTMPAAVAGTSGTVLVAAAPQHTCALSSTGAVRCWGLNDHGQLGRGSLGSFTSTPDLAVGLNDAVALATGGQQSCAVRTDGTMACWGFGPMGNGVAPSQSLQPTRASGAGGLAGLAVGAAHVLALDGAHGLWSWGANGDFQLGRSGGGDFPGAVPPGNVYWGP